MKLVSRFDWMKIKEMKEETLVTLNVTVGRKERRKETNSFLVPLGEMNRVV